MALSLGAARARDGLGRQLKRLLPHMQRIASGLPLIARLSHLLLGTRHLGPARIPWGCSLGWGDVLVVCPEPPIVERHD
jgi:hypothetical protein